MVSETFRTGVDEASATERWIVSDAASAAAAYAALPSRVWQTATKTSVASGLTLLLQDISINSVDGATNTWELDLTFSSKQAATATYNRSADIGGEYIDVWRAGAPSLQGGSPSSSTDIGGTKVDSAGEPVSQFRVRSNVQITRVLTTAPFSSIWGAIGTRNNASFEGAATGTLLFTGAKVATLDSCRYEVTYTFISDEWYHMVQRPRREADGKVELNTDKQAAFVSFFQPFPSTSNFSTLVGGSAPC
jgi:hypothetical protein